jgi:hydroxypyruvate isomerase
MPRFAANLTMLYGEHDFPARFAAAAADGFRAVECLFPYAHPAAELACRLTDHGLQLVLFNAPPGDWDAGERGLAGLPGREAEFRDGLARALDYAAILRCPRLHVMAGIAPAGVEPARLQATYRANLAWAAERAAQVVHDGQALQILIEPINTRDMPGYLLNRQAEAHAVVEAVGAPNLGVQMDLYHCQIMEGDLSTRLRRWLPGGRVRHLQIAGVPERHEPDTGELNARWLFELIDALGYTGHIGCEYRPRNAAPGGSSAGLGWARPWLG